MIDRSPEATPLSVAKFGGESMLTMETVKDRVLEDESRRLIVVSALGKLAVSRTEELGYDEGMHAEKVTDQLMEYFRSGLDTLLEEIIRRHAFEAERLLIYGEDADGAIARQELVDSFRSDIKDHNDKREFADVQLMGEIMSAKLLAAYLGDETEFIDPRDVIVFESLSDDPNDNHPIDLVETARRLKDQMTDPSKRYILGGYGGQYQGETYLLQRSGTDVIGAAVTNALGASLYEVFKEVKGVYVTNPTLLKEAEIELEDSDIIRKMTYDEARDVGVSGSQVLHPDAIGYLWNKNERHSATKDNIVTIVRSTSDPEDRGTKITPRRSAPTDETIINFNVRDYAFVKLHKFNMKGKSNYVGKLQEYLDSFEGGIIWDHMLTGTDSITAIMPARQFYQSANKKDRTESLPDFDDFIDGLENMEDMNVESHGTIGAIHLVGQEHADQYTSALITTKLADALKKKGIGQKGHVWQLGGSSSIWFIDAGVEIPAVAAVYEEFIADE